MIVNVSWRTEKTFLRPDPRKIRRLAQRIAEVAGSGLTGDQSLGVSFLSSEKMAEVNWDFLTHSGDTDVICFDYRESGAPDDDAGVDVLICPAVALREAEKRDLPYAREITLYLAHGLLHAAGYDDLQVNLKKKMRRAEKRVMTQIEQEFDLDSIFKLCREED